MVSLFKYCHYLNLEVYLPTVKHHETRRKKRNGFYDSEDELYVEEINKDNVSKLLKHLIFKCMGFLCLLFMLLHNYMDKRDKIKN